MFELTPELAEKDHIIELKLCSVLLEDNSYYPWVILVPRIKGVKNMLGLTMEEKLQLMREIALCEEVMAENFEYEQMNVTMLGNKIPQLFVNVICRKPRDKDWPMPVCNSSPKPYIKAKKEEIITKIEKGIKIKKADGKYMQY